jgi:casein kinase 1
VPSRRDDMESAALMLIHLLTPRGLSWTRKGVPKTDTEHERLKREKRAARPEMLCEGMPPEFEEFLRYCRRLAFQEQPDYNMWREQFRLLAIQEGSFGTGEFIWPPIVSWSGRMANRQ